MMSMMNNEFTDRVKHWERTLKDDFYLPLGNIAFEGFTTMAHISPEEALKGAFNPTAQGFEWGHTWEYMWLKSSVTMPKEAKGQAIVMSLDLGGEATLFVNGQPFGTRRAEWVNVPHHYMVDNFLTQKADEGEKYDLLVEAYAGHYFPDVGGCSTGPVLPGSFTDPKVEGRRAVVGSNTFGIWNEDAYQLWLDVTTLSMLFNQLGDDSLRKSHIADALEKFTLIVDFEQPREKRIADYRNAREMLKPYMQSHNGSTAPTMYAVGNAHLDLCWLWPAKETHRKTARTFAQQLRLLERYPEYQFIQSQPAAYEMCREHYPKLFEKIKEAVRQGRWIADGAMYVEPDTNMASGEALIRQLLFGKAFYKEEFGLDSHLLWLPDTFGYTAALPQILKGCRVDYLVTQKIFWSYNDGDRFPYHYFTWKGMDGSEVVSFLPTSYTYRTDPKELCEAWQSRVQKRGLDDFLLPFGYGDGGGGPCRDHIEYVLREKDLEGMPKVKIAHPQDLFEDLQQKGGPQNTWDGELYFSAHRGTYTTQANIKKNNRKSELALREVEYWGALAMLKGWAYPYETMNALWKVLLRNQFHDILPGSSIGKVYEEANKEHEELQSKAQTLANSAMQALLESQEAKAAFNSLPFERQAIVGDALITLPPMGAAKVVASKDAPKATARLTGVGAVLENDHVIVALNSLGEVLSYRHKGTGCEFTDGGMNRLLMYKDVPRLYDAWDIDSQYILQPVALEQHAQMSIGEDEGLTASVVVKRKIGESSFSQVISLKAYGVRVDFDTTVDWHELHRLLKVQFPVRVYAQNMFNEMQFGFVERPTHRSRVYDQDRFEVVNHRYTAICDQNHGCAVLNDAKYGISTNANAMELTLLRAAASPHMRSDNGTHHFTYAFYAWEGPFIASDVVKQGYDLNVPVRLMDGSLKDFSAFQIDQVNVFLETVKPAQDESGDIILRIYEAMKAQTAFTLHTMLDVQQAWLCDMLENKQETIAVTDGNMALYAAPFKILTLRLKVKAKA